MKRLSFILPIRLLAIVIPLFSTMAIAQSPGQILLDVNYENNQLNSGIIGVNATNVNPNIDAAYIVSPGATGQYAIAHKIIGGDPAYQSDGNTRSEADAVAFMPGRFYPGDIRRYEVSILLKNWVPFDGTDATETNLFQLKMSDGLPVPLMIRTQRNALRLRYGNMDQTITTVDPLDDVRPYVNQWMHFRIDVSWTTTATGYIKIYAKLPGQSDYTLLDEKLNRRTFTGDPTIGNIGYIKWGLYVAPQGITRIAYHDNIRITNLNSGPSETGLIWGNSVPDANPAYLDGPYTRAANIFNRNAYDNNSHIFIHPQIKYSASQNIVYNNSTNPVPNANDNIQGTPWSDYSRGNLIPGGATNGGATPGPSGRYLLANWTPSPNGSATPINLNQYYEFQIEPESGYHFSFTDINFTVLRGGSSQPNTFALRSSIDNFVSDIAPPLLISGTTSPTEISFNAAGLNNVNGPVTFRLYAYGATGTGTMLVGVNDFKFFGQLLPGAGSVLTNNLSAYSDSKNLNVNWQTLTENNTDYFEIQLSKDGKNFTTVETVKSKNGNSKQLQTYKADITLSHITGLLSIPLLLGFMSLNRPGKRKKALWLLSFLLFLIIGISCKKNDKILNQLNGEPLSVRIKQVQLDGKVNYWNPIQVSSTQQ